MFEGIRRKLAQVANEEEEIVFKQEITEEEKTEDTTPVKEETHVKNSSIEGNNIELKVVRPESMDEIFTIADYLIDGCTVVLNLELLDKIAITRMLDFLNGVTYTTGGEVKNISPGAYIITPSGINIQK